MNGFGNDIPDNGSYASSNSTRPFSRPFTAYLSSILSSGLVEHRFIQLPQYSIFRAILSNASILALVPSLILDDNAVSPYTIFNPFPRPVESQTHTLSPTDLQLSTLHHPYIDVIASPSLRDNILSALLSDEQEEWLCVDLHCNGFSVWGSQPWSPFSWEASQGFVSRWGWLLDHDTIRYSNFWRAERGESPLKLETNGFGAT